MRSDSTVFVDDDPSVRASLGWLLESEGLTVDTYPSAAQFLKEYDPATGGCLVLDVRMPGMDGLELQEQLLARGATLPIIFVTGHGDVPLCARAMRRGAVDFIEKPAEGEALLQRIHEAIEDDLQRRKLARDHGDVRRRIDLLTRREREVLPMLLAGKPTKRIAGELSVSAQTAAKHRTRVLEKMQVDNEAELVRLLQLYPVPPLEANHAAVRKNRLPRRAIVTQT